MPRVSVSTRQTSEEAAEETRSEELPAKVMIWSETELKQKHVKQLGASACGATAVVNLLKAFGETCDESQVVTAVKTRLRDLEAPLPEYLLSRSVAGTTHQDLIDGVKSLTEGRVFGRFFCMHPERNVNLSLWLKRWLLKGAMPLVTINCQKIPLPDGSLPDAWHHQMVCGVSEDGVHMINPNEVVTVDLLGKQLCSESVLLIRRKDVLVRWRGDLDESCWVNDSRWHELKVKGQVENVVKEETLLLLHGSELKHRELIMSHVEIPAAYKSGVTLFVQRDSETYKELLEVDELPFRLQECSPLAQQDKLNDPSAISV